MTNFDSNQIIHCIMLTHITGLGVYCMCIYVYFTIMTTMLMYVYVDFSNKIIVFPLCTAKGG